MLLILSLIQCWWLNNTGEDFGIPHEDINYTNIEFNGSTIIINVMADGANAYHEVYQNRSIVSEFLESFRNSPEPIPKNPEANVIGQKILSVAAGQKNYHNISGVAYGARVTSFDFYDATNHIESLEYVICHHKEVWNISIVAFINRNCNDRECQYVRPDDFPLEYASPCLYDVEDARSQKHFVVPAGNYTSDLFFSPPGRWPLVFSIGSVSNRGFILNHACEGAGLFMVCPGTRDNNDTAPAKIPAALPVNTTAWDSESFHESNASAAIFAGALAIIMEANPELTLSDHLFICAMTATKNNPTSFLWRTNAFGLSHNRRSGFGRLNLGKAVELAKKWPKKLGKIKLFQTADSLPGPISLTETFETINITINVPEGKFKRIKGNAKIEEGELTNESAVVEIVMNLKFADLGFGSFTCQLMSPNPNNTNKYELKILTEWSNLNEGIVKLSLPSYQFMGENPIGNWTLIIPRIDHAARGILVHVSMDIYYVDSCPDSSLIDQSDGANPNQPILFDKSSLLKQLKNRPKNYDEIQYDQLTEDDIEPPFQFLNKSIDITAGENFTVNIRVTEAFRKCWFGSYLQSDDENMQRLKVKPKTDDKNETLYLDMVPTIFKDNLSMLFVVESLGAGCGFTANMSVKYKHPPPKSNISLVNYPNSTIPINTKSVTVKWHLFLENILDDGYSTSVCISVISHQTKQVTRRTFERNTGLAELSLVDESGETPTDRNFILQISPSSPIDNPSLTFEPLSLNITLLPLPGPKVPYTTPFKTYIFVFLIIMISLFFFAFPIPLCLNLRKNKKKEEEEPFKQKAAFV